MLRYENIMDGFDPFFLHNLDLEHAILCQIVEEDSDECLLAMSWLTLPKKIKDKLLADRAMVVDEEPTEQFPIGNAPSWEQITSTMASNPKLLMSKWAWDERWDTRSTTNCLFVQFTTNYFLTLFQDVLRNSKPPKLKDLKGAIEIWTLQSLMTLLINISF